MLRGSFPSPGIAKSSATTPAIFSDGRARARSSAPDRVRPASAARASKMLVEVADSDSLEEGVGLVVVAQGREIMIVRWRGEIHAVRNICPHMSVPFSVANRVLERGAQPVHARI